MPPPNGVNDTASLQAALDTCVAYGKDCTVQLAAGKYLTSQLVAYNFHGIFKGKGKDNRTYMLQPSVQKGPWKRPQLCSTQPFEIAFSSNAQSGSIPPEQLTMS